MIFDCCDCQIFLFLTVFSLYCKIDEYSMCVCGVSKNFAVLVFRNNLNLIWSIKLDRKRLQKSVMYFESCDDTVLCMDKFWPCFDI